MAIRILNIAATGITAYSDAVSVVSNNLANLNTNGFKRSDMRFQDVMYEHLRSAGIRGSDIPTGVGEQYGQGVSIASVPTIFSQGPLTPGLDLDVAISGEGFFRVLDSQGNAFFTRLGAFQPKGTGASGIVNLQISGETYVLDPPIILPGQNAPTNVSPTGVLTQGTFSAQIELTRFQNNDGLQQVGDLLFLQTPAAGASFTGIPGTDGFGTLVDSTLETSNVNLTNELIDLIEASQGFSLNSRSFQAGNQEILTLIALVQQT